MRTKVTFVALMLCTSFILHAQVEQEAQQLAENEYQRFVEELPKAFANGKTNLFGNSKTLALKKQFFLEDNAKVFADFLGWDKKKYSQKTLGTVFQALSNNAKPGKKNPNPVTVTFDFPAQPTETKVTIQDNKKGPNVEKKATVVSYVVTTRVDVQVEANRQGVDPSIASNSIMLVWDGRLKLANGELDTKAKNSPPILRTIVIGYEEDSSEPVEEKTKIVEVIKYVEREVVVPPVVEPKQEPATTTPPVSEPVIRPVSEPPAQTVSRPVSPTGRENYKVQILLLQSYVSPTALPEKFRVENVTVEKYTDSQYTYYKYVIPANSLNEAFAIRNRMNERGILDAWIAVYENGIRVRPYQGQPENAY